MRSRQRALTLIALIAVCACGEPVGPGPEGRLALVSLNAPATLSAGAPLEVGIRYWIGACHVVTDLNRAVRGRVVEVEVRGRLFPLPPGSGCPDAIYQRDTSITVVAPPTGTVTVRGLQPGIAPIEVFVQVLP